MQGNYHENGGSFYVCLTVNQEQHGLILVFEQRPELIVYWLDTSNLATELQTHCHPTVDGIHFPSYLLVPIYLPIMTFVRTYLSVYLDKNQSLYLSIYLSI